MGGVCTKRQPMPTKIYGMPGSANTMAPVVLAKSLGVGDLEFCDLMSGAHKKPEFLAKNPWGQVPTLEEDNGFCLAEQVAIMRYLANKHKPELYGDSPESKAITDWAMDQFKHNVYGATAPKVWYPVLGYCGPPDDQKAANEEAIAKLNLFKEKFLTKTKFCGGDKLSIADYTIAPFLVALTPPGLKAKVGFECPAWVKEYCDAFKEAEPTAAMFYECGGYGLYEFVEKMSTA